MRSVALAIFPGVQSLDVAGPLDVFMEANGFVPAGQGYDITLVAADQAPLRASNGLKMSADLSFAEARRSWDLVLVAGGPDLPSADADPALTDWLAATAPLAARHGSVCTGAFALGYAGLIDDRTVTTHWQNAALLAQRFPKARVAHDRIFSRDGALVTSAGVTAGIDLGLALVQEDHGPAVALAVAKRLVVVAQRQGGQSQFSPYLMAAPEPESPIAKVHAHVMAHLRESNGVEALAAVAGMSARTFARSFKQDTQMTPADFVESARIDTARNRLEAGDLPLKAVAFDCGFGSAEHMRQVFVRRLGVTPSQYRASFRTA
jgi:transcriptional regulator GlxA family with amidase domain